MQSCHQDFLYMSHFEFEAVSFVLLQVFFTDTKECFLHFEADQDAFETVILAYNHLLMITMYIMYI